MMGRTIVLLLAASLMMRVCFAEEEEVFNVIFHLPVPGSVVDLNSAQPATIRLSVSDLGGGRQVVVFVNGIEWIR
jgi:hypothetical protein